MTSLRQEILTPIFHTANFHPKHQCHFLWKDSPMRLAAPNIINGAYGKELLSQFLLCVTVVSVVPDSVFMGAFLVWKECREFTLSRADRILNFSKRLSPSCNSNFSQNAQKLETHFGRKCFHGWFHCNSARPGGKSVFFQRRRRDIFVEYALEMNSSSVRSGIFGFAARRCRS